MNNRILIVDGHPVYANKTDGFLRGLTFSNITIAKNGQDGIELAKANKPHLVILSAMLPDMNSVDVCRQIHSFCGEETQILVQIGLFTEEEKIQEFKSSGANVVLWRKEKDLQPLEDAIQSLLFSPAIH